ncbi:MAG TPA: hypothetical protein DCP97_01920 [Ruminococcaceae bacterium]|nr:hypothetical protein [Oscillospiraceae bacterium]
MKLEDIKTEFGSAGAEYRSLPFWAWNSRLDEDEIRRQINIMHEQGIGGFFMHSRDGLETEYMGEQWNKCVMAAINEAAKLGMQAWLYDEDRWPSGTAGGTLPATYGDDSRCKGVTLEICEPDNMQYLTDSSVAALYKAKIDGMEIFSLTRLPIDDKTEIAADEKRLVVRTEVSGKSEWFNNEAPPDNLNPDSVRRFIELTHEKYKAIAGEYFGKTVPGIFTDEPSLADRHTSFAKNRGWIPWTNGFADYFKEQRGYDVFDTLPYIYFNHEKSPKARHDYWRTVSQRYAESYSKVIGQWCAQNGIAYTGHFLQEDKLGLCTRVNGSIMPHYRYQQVPGIDMLCECTNEYLTVKQCSSVAHQFGKPVVISETYGCTGWEFTFEGQKWIGDWQYALGVNRRCQHLALYSIKGCRKRDYPPCFNYNTSWWSCNYMVEDYFARLGSVLSKGEVVREVLVLHPATTAWSRLGTSPYGNPVRRLERDVPAIDEYGSRFNALLKYLAGMHYDCDLGDETLIAENGYVNADKFGIEKAEYKVVVLPPIDTMLSSTFEKLAEFMNGGGRVIAIKPLPAMLEGEKTDKLERLFKHKNCIIAENQKSAVLELEKILPRIVSIADNNGCENQSLLCMLRNLSEGYALFVANNDRSNQQKAQINISICGAVEELNLLTGEITSVEVNTTGCGISFNAAFAPTGSKLYLINPAKQPVIKQNEKSPQPELVCALPKVCRVRRNMPNVLVLDNCRYSLNGGEWSDNMQVWLMQRKVRDALDMRPIENNGILQRYKWVNTPHKNDGARLSIRFEFEVADIPKRDVHFVLEDAEHFEVTLNGTAVSNSPDGWFLDKAFSKIKLSGLIKGINTIELNCRYLNSMEIENCFIIGDFNVNCDRTVARPTDTLCIGDWTLQGLYHYAGSVSYLYNYSHTASGRRVMLEISEFSAVCIKATVNGRSYDMPWKTEKPLDITDSIKSGENSIEIEVFSSPRNMLGPFHLTTIKEENTNDTCFTPQGFRYTENYNLHPYGLMQTPRIYLL